MKKIASLALSLSIIGSLGFSNLEGYAVEENDVSIYTSEELKVIRENILDSGTPTNIANSLVEKVNKGYILDADILDVKEALNTVVTDENNIKTTTYIFEDGSRTQITEETIPFNEPPKIPNDDITIQPFSAGTITGGSCSTGSGYESCTNRVIKGGTPTYTFKFIATYQIVKGGYDKIVSVDNRTVTTAGGTATNQSLTIKKKTENANGVAEARLSADINLANSVSSFSRSLSLKVGKDKASATFNSYY